MSSILGTWLDDVSSKFMGKLHSPYIHSQHNHSFELLQIFYLELSLAHILAS